VFGSDTAYSGISQGANSTVDEDPLLDASYRPSSSSPCIDAGTYIPGARHYGGKRMSVVSPTIGAHGYWAAREVASRSLRESVTIDETRSVALTRAVA
jgi:hypothetical protein